ncbi:MAG: hypothetical protein KDI51_09485 [Xanthomonadales bacterium]|nr:hypothetical protein [Xanthomonadales bacterium]
MKMITIMGRRRYRLSAKLPVFILMVPLAWAMHTCNRKMVFSTDIVNKTDHDILEARAAFDGHVVKWGRVRAGAGAGYASFSRQRPSTEVSVSWRSTVSGDVSLNAHVPEPPANINAYSKIELNFIIESDESVVLQWRAVDIGVPPFERKPDLISPSGL